MFLFSCLFVCFLACLCVWGYVGVFLSFFDYCCVCVLGFVFCFALLCFVLFCVNIYWVLCGKSREKNVCTNTRLGHRVTVSIFYSRPIQRIITRNLEKSQDYQIKRQIWWSFIQQRHAVTWFFYNVVILKSNVTGLYPILRYVTISFKCVSKQLKNVNKNYTTKQIQTKAEQVKTK